MIRMNRMHLINWHNFADNIIDFKNVTYLIGLNAVGKTTIMDGIRYCLTTNKNFNTAGNKKSGRSLQGSVHQKQRAEEVYLRPKHTVTFIGIEFLDETINKTFVITVRVESESPFQELRHVSQDWYISKLGLKLEDMPFFIEIGDNKRPSSREEFTLPNKGLDKAPNQKEAQRRICRVLGIGEADYITGKKFFDVFHMGTSLEEISDIRKFIYTYILPDPEIDVDILHSDMRELERLAEILEEAQNKEKLLKEIVECLLKASDLDDKINVNKVLVLYGKLQNEKVKYESSLSEIRKAKEKSERCRADLENLEGKLEEAQDKLDEARDKINSDKDNEALEYFKNEKDKSLKEYSKALHNLNEYENAIERLEKLIEKLNEMKFKVGNDISNIFNQAVSVGERLSSVEKFEDELRVLYEKLKDKDAEIRINNREIDKNIINLNNRIKVLESGKMCYPSGAEMVRDTINTRLKELGKEESAKIFCELLYINDDTWQNAVESYLNTQRFNIIVEPKFYNVAKQVFVELKSEVKNIGLIDTVRLDRDSKVREYSDIPKLADKVESKNPYAKLYVEFLLKDVVCCESENDLENYKRSVTKDLLRYQGYCLHRMKISEHYIGINARLQQLEKSKNDLAKLFLEKKSVEKELVDFKYLDSMCQEFISGTAAKEIKENIGAKKESERLYDYLEKVQAQIEHFEKNPILKALFSKREEYAKLVKDIYDEITNVKSDEKIALGIIENEKIKLKAIQINIDKAAEEYDNAAITHAQYINDVTEKYNIVRKNRSPSEIVINYSNYIQQGINELNNYINKELLPKQRDYNSLYTCDYLEGLDGKNDYQLAYDSLINIDLENHKENIRQAQIRCKERFRKEILFRMKDDILKAKQQFKAINKVMDKLPYGEENYRFEIDGSKDKELNIFYNIIMDKNNEQIEKDNELLYFLATQSDVFENQIEEFMSRIMVDVETHAQEQLTGKKNGSKEISRYVDYRTYLDYDIMVKNSATGFEVPLSKVSGDGSGGENQAPFYVAICASFLQIYEQRDNCIRLVLLDEAFNKMTSDRIEPMMKMFKELGLQLVLISTVEKCSSIYPYCNITYSIVKSGARNAIMPFEKI